HAGLQRPPECRDRVLRLFQTSPTVSERDRDLTLRCFAHPLVSIGRARARRDTRLADLTLRCFAHSLIVPRRGTGAARSLKRAQGGAEGRSVPGGCAWFPKDHQDGEEAVTTIRANCPSCGDVQLTADDLTV